MRWLWIIVIALLGIALAGCPKKVVKTELSGVEKDNLLAESPTPPELGQAKLKLEFASAQPNPGKKPLLLDFTITDLAGNEAKPQLIDPKQPVKGELGMDGWTYTVLPRLDESRTSNNKLQEAFVRGYYCFEVFDPQGQKAGHFDLLNTGNLMCKGQTEIPGAIVEPISYNKRTLFLLWSAPTPDGRRNLLLGLEWQPAKYPGDYDVKAPDGWTYAVNYPQGTLHAYQPSMLNGWPESFRLLALGEQQASEAYHEQRLEELQQAQRQSCGG